MGTAQVGSCTCAYLLTCCSVVSSDRHWREYCPRLSPSARWAWRMSRRSSCRITAPSSPKTPKAVATTTEGRPTTRTKRAAAAHVWTALNSEGPACICVCVRLVNDMSTVCVLGGGCWVVGRGWCGLLPSVSLHITANCPTATATITLCHISSHSPLPPLPSTHHWPPLWSFGPSSILFVCFFVFCFSSVPIIVIVIITVCKWTITHLCVCPLSLSLSLFHHLLLEQQHSNFTLHNKNIKNNWYWVTQHFEHYSLQNFINVF